MFPSKGLVEPFSFFLICRIILPEIERKTTGTDKRKLQEAMGWEWEGVFGVTHPSPGIGEKGIRVRGNKGLHLELCSGSFICFWFKFWL